MQPGLFENSFASLKVKKISEIYQEVKDFDLVITSDKTLMVSLKALHSRARLGVFCATPHSLAIKYAQKYFTQPRLDIADLVISFATEIQRDLADAYRIYERLIDLWQACANLESVEKYLGKNFVSYAEKFASLESIHLAMQSFDPKEIFDLCSLRSDSRIAVIGFDKSGQKTQELSSLINFSALELRMLPGSFYCISPFYFNNQKNQRYPIHSFSSNYAAVIAVTDLLNPQNAGSAAIVVEKDSALEQMTRLELAGKDIGIHEAATLDQDNLVRFYLDWLDICERFEAMNIAEILDFAYFWGWLISPRYSLVRVGVCLKATELNYLAEKSLLSLQQLALKILEHRSLSYSEIWQDILNRDEENLKNQRTLEFKSAFTQVLHLLQLTKTVPSAETTAELNYYLLKFKPVSQKSSGGLIFVDPLNSQFVARENIFYLGVNNSWTRSTKASSYKDIQRESCKNTLNFMLLLGQDSRQGFFLSQTEDPERQVPPYHFQQIYQRAIANYEDSPDIFEFKKYGALPRENLFFDSYRNRKRKDYTKTEDPPVVFSNSSLRDFELCSKKEYFRRIILMPDQYHFLKGNLLHEFAEMNLTEKTSRGSGIVNLAEFVNRSLDYLALFSSVDEVLAKELDLGFRKIQLFQDRLSVDQDFLRNSKTKFAIKKGESRNYFTDLISEKNALENCEISLAGTRGVSGNLDLLLAADKIIDYKSSKFPKARSQLMKEFYPDKSSVDCDFQSLIYIYLVRENFHTKEPEFQYFYPLARLGEGIYAKLAGEESGVENLLVRLEYHDIEFCNYVSQDSFLQQLQVIKTEAKTALPKWKFLLNLSSVGFLHEILQNSRWQKLMSNSNSFYTELKAEIRENHIFKKQLAEAPELDEAAEVLADIITTLRFNLNFNSKNIKDKPPFNSIHVFKDDMINLFERITLARRRKKKMIEKFFEADARNGKICIQCEFARLCLRQLDNSDLADEQEEIVFE